jgi:hypothetical protein
MEANKLFEKNTLIKSIDKKKKKKHDTLMFEMLHNKFKTLNTYL